MSIPTSDTSSRNPHRRTSGNNARSPREPKVLKADARLTPVSDVVHTGRVKFFNVVNGYGFIERLGEKDMHVHASAVRASGMPPLQKDMIVTFQIADSASKSGSMTACNLRLAPQR